METGVVLETVVVIEAVDFVGSLQRSVLQQVKSKAWDIPTSFGPRYEQNSAETAKYICTKLPVAIAEGEQMFSWSLNPLSFLN